MPPTIALLIWFVLLLALLYFDPARDSHASWALWVPLTWIFIVGSRLPSQWFGIRVSDAATAFQEGNSIDRSILFFLIVLGILILVSRSFQWGRFFSHNIPLILFLSFGLLSFVWSDFPFIAFKRWFRDLGSYVAVLLILSDPNPIEAARTVLRRFSFVTIPLCILLFKYYPQMGIQYEPWRGTEMFVGATTSKNMLGVACLISGLYFFWDTVTRWPNRKDRQTRRILMVNGAFMVMTLWVLHLSDSATSRACLLLGCSVIFAAYSKLFQRHLKVLIPICLCLYPILAFGLGLNATLIKALGRNPTLTDRTFLWDFLLGMKTNPIFGTGYESFWLGSRLQTVWTKFPGIPEAHNGYLDIYLDLGLVGILLLAVFLIASYRVICQELKSSSELGSLGLGLWTVLIFYNVTEAAFTGFHLMWVIFLVGAVEVPKRLPVLARFAPQERYPKLASGTGNRRFAANKANDRRGPTGVEIKSHINRSRMKTTIKKGDTGRFRTKNENGVDEDLIYHGF